MRSKLFKYLALINIMNILYGNPNNIQNINDSLETRIKQLEQKIKLIDEVIDAKDELFKNIDKINENSIAAVRNKEFSNKINLLLDSLYTKVDSINFLDMSQEGSFERAFIEARLKYGKNKTFRWNGKQYSTDYTDESRASPTVLKIEELIISLEQKEKLINDLISNLQIDSDNKIQTLNKTVSMQSLYWLIAILIIIILVTAIFIFLKSKVKEQKNSLTSVKATQKKLEVESVQLDTKLVQVLEQRLEGVDRQKQASSENDHSLPLALANEIHRMKKRLKTMEDSHATKVLINRIDKLEEKINDMGYEIIDLVNEQYNEGMNVKVVHQMSSGELKAGEQVIAKVIKPHIKFKGIIKQNAEVEVHVGV